MFEYVTGGAFIVLKLTMTIVLNCIVNITAHQQRICFKIY
jgi:hypothetical protein